MSSLSCGGAAAAAAWASKDLNQTGRGIKTVSCNDDSCRIVGRRSVLVGEGHVHYRDDKTGDVSQGFLGGPGGEGAKIARASLTHQQQLVTSTEAPIGRGASAARGVRRKTRGKSGRTTDLAADATTAGESLVQQDQSPPPFDFLPGKRRHSQLSSSPSLSNAGKDGEEGFGGGTENPSRTAPAFSCCGGETSTGFDCGGTTRGCAGASGSDSDDGADGGYLTLGDGITLVTKRGNLLYCRSCNEGGCLKGCDICALAYHRNCLPRGSKSRLAALIQIEGRDHWFCPACVETGGVNLVDGRELGTASPDAGRQPGGKQDGPPTTPWSSLLAAANAASKEEEKTTERQGNRRYNLRHMVAAPEGEGRSCSLCHKTTRHAWMECRGLATRVSRGHVTCFPCLLARQFLSQADVTRGLKKWETCLVCITLTPMRASARLKAKAAQSAR